MGGRNAGVLAKEGRKGARDRRRRKPDKEKGRMRLLGVKYKA